MNWEIIITVLVCAALILAIFVAEEVREANQRIDDLLSDLDE